MTFLEATHAAQSQTSAPQPSPHFHVERPAGPTHDSELRSPTLLLSCYFPRSIALEGVGTLVAGVSRGLAELDWRVRLLSPGGQSPEARASELLTYRPGSLGLWRYTKCLKQESATADAVLEIENNPNLAGLSNCSRQPERTFLYFTSPLQSLSTLHEMGHSRQAFLHALTKHHGLARCWDWSRRRCVVATRFQAEQLHRLGAADVQIVPGGGISRLASAPSRTEARRELGWDDRPVVGYLGHYSPAKGVPVLLDAFTRYGGPAALALAYSGKGHLPRVAESQLASLRQSGRVRELGVVNPLKFLAACDVTVLPFVTSSIHHLPLVMLESFAASTAVIVSRVGGVHEPIESGRCGVTVPPRDPSALADALQHTLADLPAVHQSGRQARLLFENELANEVFCERLSNILHGGRA